MQRHSLAILLALVCAGHTLPVLAEVAVMPAPTPTAPAQPTPAPPTPEQAARQAMDQVLAGIHVVSEYERTMERSALTLLADNSSFMLRDARLIPARENGVLVGVRTYGFRDGSVLAALGLRAGDTITSINGLPVGSPQQALEAYAALRGSDRLVIALIRRGQAQTLLVRVVDAAP